MTLTIVTEPSTEPIRLTDAKDHLRLSETVGLAEDLVLSSFITASRRYAEQVQGRAYLEQTWRLMLDDFPNLAYITIPRPPLMSVTHVKYYGIGGTASTLSTDVYYVDTDSEPGRVHLGYSEIWPSDTLRPANGVEVEFVAGYGSTASAVPMEIRQAMSMLVGHMYERREGTDASTMIIREVPLGVQALLGLDRVWPI